MFKSFWNKFYGGKNPNWLPERFKHWPEILTIAWWRWCLRYPALAPERIRLHYVRHIKRQLRRPWCWITKHQPYNSGSWGYSASKCARCSKLLSFRGYCGPYKNLPIK